MRKLYNSVLFVFHTVCLLFFWGACAVQYVSPSNWTHETDFWFVVVGALLLGLYCFVGYQVYLHSSLEKWVREWNTALAYLEVIIVMLPVLLSIANIEWKWHWEVVVLQIMLLSVRIVINRYLRSDQPS